ncbi:hypothetical protein T440DRAFT_215747 [Plenodomus tracheiphilus IPT5]|uniref:RanBD1 domain-containing protein n=1 Tax=Plenodomus tracheiphilus IPT5 TaxID=1408161 RepID=A0A6A7AUP4_9PLEO|nr:hypothetical protein T440DRAFT_215747 [Plenodomus tracheiphilus IPT5]
MTGAPEQKEGAVAATSSTVESKDSTEAGVNSPARSDKSSDSEGKEVRDKLKDTQIDAPATSHPTSESDQHMKDTLNGGVKAADLSASGSDSERGRLRRKRSREDFEEEAEAEKQPGKKTEVGSERHRRKKSRDISKDELPTTKPVPSTISRIEENDVDEQMTTPKKDNVAAITSDKVSGTGTSPKNKRTREQAEKETGATENNSGGADVNGMPAIETSEERDSKRLRDQGAQLGKGAAEPKAKIPSGSGFANTSAASPFAAMAAKPQASKASDKAEPIPQTSDDKFKSSGFGGFASSAVSPFGGFGGSKPSTSSPFAAASGSKLSSFAGSKSPDSGTSGFGGLGSSSKPTLGGSTFGSSTGFAGLASAPKGTGLPSFGGSTGSLEITGLKTKTDKPFGAAANGEASDDDDGEESGSEATSKEERQSSQPLLSQQPHETGEEGESTVWVGRAKLYTMAGEASNRAWQERGSGNFKFNITDEEPRKARFVLRADGTHRLLLNAAVTKKMIFGGNAQGEKPKDTRLLFNSSTPDGELEMHLLKLKAENAVKLWEEVTKVQEREL